jgi:uncharacterized membrane protein YbaN (DUF454 family)
VKNILALFGIISLTLGIIGVFLPLIPTTPFILLSAALFARSSDKLNFWLRNHKIFGQLITDFADDKSIPLHAKISSLSILWITMLYTIFVVANEKLWLQILLATIAIGVSIHILGFKTKKKQVKPPSV